MTTRENGIASIRCWNLAGSLKVWNGIDPLGSAHTRFLCVYVIARAAQRTYKYAFLFVSGWSVDDGNTGPVQQPLSLNVFRVAWTTFPSHSAIVAHTGYNGNTDTQKRLQFYFIVPKFSHVQGNVVFDGINGQTTSTSIDHPTQRYEEMERNSKWIYDEYQPLMWK